MKNEDLYYKIDEDESLTDAEKREIWEAEQALISAFFSDGKIKKSISDKIGFNDNLHLNNCPFKNKINYVKFRFNANYVQQLSLF